MLLSVQQKDEMKWVLFWVFIAIFVLVVLGTLWAIFIGKTNLLDHEREILFKAFIVEVGAAVIALFYSVFGLQKKGGAYDRRLRFSLGEYEDIKRLDGKKVIVEPSTIDGENLEVIEKTILYDEGPFIPLTLPSAAYSVYLTVNLDEQTYFGSLIVSSHIVDLKKE